ncbi:MAG: helix-turn-helix domain-containing protein [Patescibacteria group bacterium]|nr:helix-turn-helix domain-containing protein [Patescibacteria group bacterium]
MQSKTIGQIVREERLRQGYSLTDISEKSKIKLKYLKALENDQFDQLPAATFVRGYIKAYARILDIDFKSLVALLRRDYQERAGGQLLPREFINPVIRQGKYRQPVTFVVLGVVTVFLALISYVGWQWFSLNRPPKLEVFVPEENQFVSSEVVVEGQTEEETIVTVNAQPVAIDPDGTFRTEILLPREGISTITIESTDKNGKTSLEQRTIYVKF